jgi:hypothetical protein
MSREGGAAVSTLTVVPAAARRTRRSLPSSSSSSSRSACATALRADLRSPAPSARARIAFVIRLYSNSLSNNAGSEPEARGPGLRSLPKTRPQVLVPVPGHRRATQPELACHRAPRHARNGQRVIDVRSVAPATYAARSRAVMTRPRDTVRYPSRRSREPFRPPSKLEIRGRLAPRRAPRFFRRCVTEARPRSRARSASAPSRTLRRHSAACLIQEE